MRIFRKRKKFGNFHGKPDDAPLPDIVYQMGAESAAQYAAARSMSPDPYGAINPVQQEAIYDYPQVPMPMEENFEEQVRASSPFRFMASALGIGRSKSRERHRHRPHDRFMVAGSPIHFNERPPGTPAKYRRRAASPELIQPRASSPYHFGQQERVPSPLHFARSERASSPFQFAQQPRPSSPDVVMRRLQRAQLSQDLQHVERQQRHQQELMQMNSMQYMPEYQQPYYSLINSNPYPSIQQPQMYSYY